MYEEEDLWDWSRGGSRAPGWGIRSIKFSPEGADGKEILVFTEVSLSHSIALVAQVLIRRPLDCAAHVSAAFD